MKPALVLTVEPALGVDIERMCLELQQLSRTLRVEVRCKANDVMFYARPRGDAETLIASYRRVSSTPGLKFRAAHSWVE
jgi:hypothetical protein